MAIEVKSSGNYTPEYIASLNINNDDAQNFKTNSVYGINYEGDHNGMSVFSAKLIEGDVMGNIGIGSGSGISLGIEGGIDSIKSELLGEGAFQKNLLAVFDGSVLNIFGLPKNECFAIKSLGVLTSLNNISALKQINLDIKGKTSVIAQGEQQH